MLDFEKAKLSNYFVLVKKSSALPSSSSPPSSRNVWGNLLGSLVVLLQRPLDTLCRRRSPLDTMCFAWRSSESLWKRKHLRFDEIIFYFLYSHCPYMITSWSCVSSWSIDLIAPILFKAILIYRQHKFVIIYMFKVFLSLVLTSGKPSTRISPLRLL